MPQRWTRQAIGAAMANDFDAEWAAFREIARAEEYPAAHEWRRVKWARQERETAKESETDDKQ